jgi:P-type E1-E2 ATPase
VTDIKEIPGQGMVGNTNNNIQIAAGNMLLFNRLGIDIDTIVKNDLESLASKGYTNILVSYNKKIIGVISLFDNVRESFGEIYNFLTKKHIEINVLTGDTKETAENVLKDYTDINIFSSLSPIEKVEVIKNNLHKFPIMVGDGINDAPSLKQAFIGIGMGKGTEIALESSDAVFVNSNLLLLKDFLNLSKKTRGIIIENLFWAFSYNFVTIPLAISGKIHPVFSAVLMSISSLIVVFNSLRIKTLSR